MTQTELFTAVRALGLSVSKTEGANEYRIALKTPWRNVNEASAYYTNDRQDALDTATRMAEQRAQQLARERGQASEERGQASEPAASPSATGQLANPRRTACDDCKRSYGPHAAPCTH